MESYGNFTLPEILLVLGVTVDNGLRRDSGFKFQLSVGFHSLVPHRFLSHPHCPNEGYRDVQVHIHLPEVKVKCSYQSFATSALCSILQLYRTTLLRILHFCLFIGDQAPLFLASYPRTFHGKLLSTSPSSPI